MKTMMLSLSSEIDDFLTAFAYERGITKAEAMKGAFALLKIAYDRSIRAMAHHLDWSAACQIILSKPLAW